MTKENLFVTISKEVSNFPNPSEVYLMAGETLEVAGACESVRKAVSEALVEARNNPIGALKHAYNTAPASMDIVFADGSVGCIETDGICVEFTVRKTSHSPDVYRVLFSRVGASQLLVNVYQKIEDLTVRVRQLETAGSV